MVFEKNQEIGIGLIHFPNHISQDNAAGTFRLLVAFEAGTKAFARNQTGQSENGQCPYPDHCGAEPS